MEQSELDYKKEQQIKKDKMQERGRIKFGDIEVVVKPIFLGEEEQYFADIVYMPIPKKEDENEDYTDKELAKHLTMLFNDNFHTNKDQMILKLKREKELAESFIGKRILKISKAFKGFVSKIQKLKCGFHKKFNTKKYYSNKKIYPLIKWIQRKVYINNKRISFYDLEHKYNLSKAEIGRILVLLHELSGF